MIGVLDYIRNAFRYGNTLVQIITINVVVYLLLIVASLGLSIAGMNFFKAYEFISDWLVLKAYVQDFIHQPWGLFTYSFTHGVNFFHLLFNMLFLYWLGILVQEYIGSQKLLNIYIIGAIFAGLVHVSFYAVLKIIGPSVIIFDNNLAGASAAAFAVAFAAVTLVPEYELMLLGIIPVRIKYLVWIMLVISFFVYDGRAFHLASGISHASGAFIGYLYIKLLRNGTDLGSPIEAFSDWWRGLRQPKIQQPPRRRYAEKAHASRGSYTPLDLENPEYFPDQDEVDAILDKINNSGYESLTKEEKQKLFRASQKKD